jgi:hypothetical protein
MSFTPLRSILAQNIREAGIGRQVLAARTIETFNQIIREIFGPGAAGKARAMYLRNKNLTVGCLSSVVTQEVYLKRGKIIKELNKRLGVEAVEELKFRM